MKNDSWKYCPSCQGKTISIIDKKWLICLAGAACEACRNETIFSLDYVRGYWEGFEVSKRKALWVNVDMQKANNILRAAMYDIIELEAKPSPSSASAVHLIAENALSESALDEDGNISKHESCKDQGDGYWDCSKLVRCVNPQCSDCPQKQLKPTSMAEPPNIRS